MTENEPISAFAYDVAKQIEQMVIDRTKNLDGRNRELEARIFQWYMKTKDEKFAEFFYIEQITPPFNL